MNRKFLLTLLGSPTVFASMMSILAVINPNPAHAAQNQTVFLTKDGRSCVPHPHGATSLVCIRLSKQELASRRSQPAQTVNGEQVSDKKVAMLEFSEEESNAAIQLFGCDCPYCMNFLRALRGQTPMVY
ncbi:hypothetical protein WA1_49975 [Scytonema hofmannii PCC 7110]|uniref:Secreted protein n=1 Tax=Scytonema hofmannii PCC 7110 TaxID=128403 RepID=A0A139WR23_9CYAN|nr:hypothetical protein [Scytonema hofmannii]KYC34859.1 hypothetical protein WA1_49975 [Scytonema hofmannii PCC 7110]